LGKPYSGEIVKLSATYQWAMKTNIDALTEAVSNLHGLPLLVTGSGGSLTAAYIAASLHETYAHTISKAVTPLELISSNLKQKNMGVIFVSAGGRNIDIIRAFRAVIECEPTRIIVICTNKNSPLSQLAGALSFVDLIDFELPAGKDGFLATNSLLAFSVLMCRAWAKAYNEESLLPPELSLLLHPGESESFYHENLRRNSAKLWNKGTISVLYGTQVKSAIIDFESKFTEAALGSVQIADYRNFAHGRHHWLAKHADSTAIVAFVTEEDQMLASKTLLLIPNKIPILKIELPFSGDRAIISALVQIFHLTGMAGEKRGIDPGRPKVPDFGRKIYHLRTSELDSQNDYGLNNFERLAIERKTRRSISELAQSDDVIFWKQALDVFVKGLENSSFHGIVFDFDGTLCDRHERFTGIGKEISNQLIKLLEAEIKIGIATGRGKSVLADLQKKIPQAMWGNVLIGFYNGSETAILGDEINLFTSQEIEPKLKKLNEIFEASNDLKRFFEWETRRTQITLQPKGGFYALEILQIVQEVIEKNELAGLSILYSSHSIDVLAPGVSKINVVKALKNEIGKQSKIVCIGDRGRFPGNDYLLLAEPFSLSVEELSLNPETCWNLAPSGFRGIQGTNHYLSSLKLDNQSFRFNLKRLMETRK
jgi:HAD superfamily hydrolase (TIGR01484 family)